MPATAALGLLMVLGFAQSGFAQSTNGPLTFGNNFFVTGDYVVAGAYGLNKQAKNGFARGTINVPDKDPITGTMNPGITGTTSVPAGADILAVLLYWQTVESASTTPGQPGSGQNGFFRPVFTGGPQTGYPIAGATNSQNTVSFSNGGCTGSSTGKVVRTYRADVRGYLPQDATGNILANGTYEVMLASAGQGTPVTLGATLVIIYRVLSPNVPLNSIVIYDGSYAPGGTLLNMTQTVQGFYDAAHDPLFRVSTLTHIVGSTHSNKFQTVSLNNIALHSLYPNGLPSLPGWYGSYDNTKWTFVGNPNNANANPVQAGDASATTMVAPTASQGGCPSWGAVIFSTTVQDSDKDGLPLVWKTNQGYCDASINEGSCTHGNPSTGWVDLTGATPGQKDVFVQLDYMCSVVISESNGTCDVRNNNDTTMGFYSFDPRVKVNPQDPDPVQKVVDAFATSPNHAPVNLHVIYTHAIQEQTCQDIPGQPPRLCPFPNQPGVVGWPGGVLYFQNQFVDPTGNICTPTPPNPPAAGCVPVFQRGKKDSWHYALFAHALGLANWNFPSGQLTDSTGAVPGVVVQAANSNTVTFYTAHGHGLVANDSVHGNGRVNVSFATSNPNLNGTWFVTSVNCPINLATNPPTGLGDCSVSNTAPGPYTFQIQIGTSVSTATSYTQQTDPNLVAGSGQAGRVSGFSDIGGAHSLITLGNWKPVLQTWQVKAGTFMHELGHSLGLTHGGFYFDSLSSTNNNYRPTIEANCKPNHQSVMNYDFQIDLLDTGTVDANGLPIKVLDYSGQPLDPLNKLANNSNPFTTLTPFYPTTAWHGTATQLGGTVGSRFPVYCDGTPIPIGTDLFRVYRSTSLLSWAAGQDINLDGNTTIEPPLRGHDDWNGIGTNELVTAPGIDMRQISATGSVTAANLVGGAGGYTPPAGGGGGYTPPAGGGGGYTPPAGGGGGYVPPAGGGGGYVPPAGGGGGYPAPSGLGGGGGYAPPQGGGGGLGEITQEIANSFTRPPTNLTASEAASPRTITLNWMQPNFGAIVKYKIYRSVPGGSFSVIATLSGTPPATTLMDHPACNPGGYRYQVTAVVISDITNAEQESVGSNIVPGPNQPKLTGCYTFPGFASPTAGSSVVAGTTAVPVIWSVQDDFYTQGAFVHNTTANTLVAIGPISNDVVCTTAAGLRTTLAFAGAGINTIGNQFSFNWDTSRGFNGTAAPFPAGCYRLELDLDSGQPTFGGQPASAFQVLIYLSDVSLQVTTTALPNGVVGSPYNKTLTETGGTTGGGQPFTWTVISGALPPGIALGLAPDGVSGALTGIPTVPGTYNFTVKVTDSIGDFGSQALTLVVDAVVTNTLDVGAGSLRQAILDVNAAQPGPQPLRILFNIPGNGVHTIMPSSPLPTLTSPTILDATTQPGWAGPPIIELNGSNAGAAVNGIHIAAGSSTVHGLAINRFSSNGILLDTNGGDVVQGNYIGTDVTGTVAQPNGGNGIQIVATPNNVVGGANVISGNSGEGVRIDGTLATNNAIVSNRIGTDPTGLVAVGNSASGIYIRRAPGNSVAGNVVSGNLGFAGITICGIDPGGCGGGDVSGIDETSNAAGNAVLGNFIGTDASGVNPLGNNQAGVSIDGAPNTQVGRTGASTANVISNNGTNDVQIFSPAASGNMIEGNTIQGKPNATTVGISEGIFASLSAGTRNTFTRNSISGHGGLGIDLAPPGVNPNVTGGANNYPVIASAQVASGTINGTLNGPANATFTIEFFSNSGCNASGNGEGAVFLGSRSVTTDGTGNVVFAAPIAGLVAGNRITATSTDAFGTTSEFSACVTAN
jgi:hypothetical protein